MLIIQPILITLILEFIQKPPGQDGGIWYGLGLVLAYIVVDLCESLSWEQGSFIQTTLGIKANHGVVSLIYEKILRISSATNKHFSQGEIINFIDVDVERITNLAFVFPLVARFPFQLLFSIGFLFFYFGISIFVAIGVGCVLGFLNFCSAKTRAALQRKILREKDERMRYTTEVVNNIKVIKLNSWKDLFISKILRIRNREIFLTKIYVWLDAFECFITWMVAPSLIISTLSMHFYLGGEISVARAYAGIQVFTLLEHPLRWFPLFVSALLEFTVSMKRIQKFLLCNEINPDLVTYNHEGLQKSEVDVKIEDANFTWSGLKQDAPGRRRRKQLKEEEKKGKFLTIFTEP